MDFIPTSKPGLQLKSKFTPVAKGAAVLTEIVESIPDIAHYELINKPIISTTIIYIPAGFGKS